jgi:hypothetical protein
MPLESAGAAETQPVATVGAVGAVVDADGARTEPVPAAAGGGGGGGLSSRRTGPSHARPRPTPRGHRPWLVAALVAALLFALTWVLIAATSDPLHPKTAAREAAQGTAQDALPPDTPVTFANAWSGLVSAIASAQAGDDVSDQVAEELTKKANELLDAYREGDPEKLGESLQHLKEELAKAVEDEEIAPSAAHAVDTAISDLVVALQNEGALGEVVPTGPTGETGGSGKEDKHGSPPYGEANGNEGD